MKKPVLYLGVIALLAVIGIGMIVLTFDNAGVEVPASNDTVNETTMATQNVKESGPWDVSGPGPVWKLYAADDGTLYSFQGEHGNTVKAIDPNGSVKWEYQVPDEWRVSNVMYRQIDTEEPRAFGNLYSPFIGPAFSLDNGTLYLYLRENKITDYNNYPGEEHPNNQYDGYKLTENLLAIKNGQVLWDKRISNEHHSFDDSNVFAQNGRVYVFDDYSVKVFSDNGSMLFRIDNASSPPAVDEAGNIYVVPAIPGAESISYMFSRYQNTIYREPANLVQAYSPDGTLMWEKDVGNGIVRPKMLEELSYQFDMLPLYRNRMLYVPTGNGIMALDTDGNVIWSKKYDHPVELLSSLPFDQNGSIYITDGPVPGKYVRAISRDGSERLLNHAYGIHGDASDGAVYDVRGGRSFPPVFLPENGSHAVLLSGMYLTANSLQNDAELWRQKIEYNMTNVVIDSDNAGKLITLEFQIYASDGSHTGTVQTIRTARDTVYVSYFDADYDWPIVINESRCNYSSTILAFDKADGRLLWQKPLDSFVTSMTVNNDTLYYGTQGGNVSGGITRDRSEPPPIAPAIINDDIGKVVGTVAGGTAITAAAVLFIKFFAMGGLARTRGQLNANDNRNKTLEFVAVHPGSTLYEIAHGLDMNVGTIRYHLFILGMNHRVVIFKSDGKFVRYFTNSGSYTRDEQFLLSLVRRDSVRKILNLLIEKTELSNLEISEALGMHDSATSRYLKELADRGVVEKSILAGGRTSYSISCEYREPVISAIERIARD